MPGCTRASVAKTRGQHTDPIELATLRAFVETSSDAMFALDLSEHVVSWNRSAERIFGYDTSEVLGRLVVMLLPDHLRDGLTTVIDAVRAGDRVEHIEIEMRRKDGMPIPVSLSVSPVSDRPVRSMASARLPVTSPSNSWRRRTWPRWSGG